MNTMGTSSQQNDDLAGKHEKLSNDEIHICIEMIEQHQLLVRERTGPELVDVMYFPILENH